LVTTGSVRGNTFAYTNGNVLIVFRRPIHDIPPRLGETILVVNAGPIDYFTNLAPNTKVTITAYTGGQLGQECDNSVFVAMASVKISPSGPPDAVGRNLTQLPAGVGRNGHLRVRRQLVK